MAFKSYLIRQYEHTHENSFFRVFSKQLRSSFQDTEDLHILVGNVSCNGHQIDALLISSGRLIVIDFKNYGGALIFSENNPWQISSGDNFIFVKGGGGIRNPYQQVNAYRHSLIQFLGNRQNEYLDSNHDNFNLGHVSGLILFHQPITFNNDTIPSNIRVYFDIADCTNYNSKIVDRFSSKLLLSVTEIVKILSVLDIKEDNIYDETLEQTPEIPPDNNQNAVARLELVQQILTNVNATTEIEKLIAYYQTLINLERKKEPKVHNEQYCNITWENIVDSITINIENYPTFHQLFLQNASSQFPKSLFIGINFNLNNQTFPLLSNIIPCRDIFPNTNVESQIQEFTLYSKPLDDRNYPDELIEELSTELNQKNTISEKIEVLKNYLGDVELVPNITLAFSDENPFTSQLLSELKKISNDNLISQNSFLDCFLTKKAITNNLQQINDVDFIQISPLNTNQKEAVRFSFNQPLTVITGPPGTGKTQVVLNILANAVVHNKKVLLASKNNQAVDNVKERITNLVQEPNYFLRFGSKNEVREKTKPNIESFIRRIHNNILTDNSTELSELHNKINFLKKIIHESLEQIHRRKNLENEVPLIEKKVIDMEKEYYEWLAPEIIESLKIFSNISTVNLNKNISDLNVIHAEVVNKYPGFFKIFFNLFNKKRFAIKLVTIFDSLPNELKNFAIVQGNDIKPTELRSGEKILLHLTNLVKFLKSGIQLIERNNILKNEIGKLKKQLAKSQDEIVKIRNIEPNLQNLILEKQTELDNLGIPLLDSVIHEKIRCGDAAMIQRFKNYIPDNIPWRTEEIPEFIVTSQSFLETFNINAITSLTIKSAFPLENELFDLVVIDEASQCDIASALPLIFRAKQLVVIGDPLQLKHITKVKDYEEKYIINTLGINSNLQLNYTNESLYDYCYNLSIESKSQGVFLKDHYRCHPEIITYSNRTFYGPKLGQELDIQTSPGNYNFEPKGIFWININGNHDDHQNINLAELTRSIELARSLADRNQDISIGITTPFTDQAKKINQAIPNNYRARIKADTVHKFQGDEKDIIIFSLVVSNNSSKHKANWINNDVPYLINVAVTRAKNTLYIVGNANYCKTLPKDSPLGLLFRYINEVNPIKYNDDKIF